MKVNNETVDQLAKLAKLSFDGERKEEIKADMDKIIGFIEKLNELDTDNVEPLIFMNEEINKVRKDVAFNESTQKEALENAPQKDSDYFKIPKVLKK